MINFFLLWIGVISLIAVIMVAADKVAAQTKGARRISENTLLGIAALGGALAMLASMLFVRHKTKHIKFMAGLPLIIVLQVIFTVFLFLIKHV